MLDLQILEQQRERYLQFGNRVSQFNFSSEVPFIALPSTVQDTPHSILVAQVIHITDRL